MPEDLDLCVWLLLLSSVQGKARCFGVSCDLNPAVIVYVVDIDRVGRLLQVVGGRVLASEGHETR